MQNFMIVSGNGRNSGKTSFVCGVIKSISKKYSITAIKISPHIHAEDSRGILVKEEHFIISKEESKNGPKDTSRMLEAGASQVFYIEVLDNHLLTAFNKLISIANLSGPVICESGGLRKFIEPSMFIMLNRNDGRDTKEGFGILMPLADKIVLFDGRSFDKSPDKIAFESNKWFFK